MSQSIRLITDQDFEEAMQRQARLRVFKNDHIIDTNGIIIRFDQQTVVVQAGVGDLAYHSREACEFFELRKR
ncbi:hypothetical protein [Cohnella abietis]|uniref:Uncharacterized protein n=1 Tax=Cohnella abietis TaxID=2507935 RepID=A0A3T1CZX7_9BACL|nr:hypothetical protein [Cohnella abietis]BBI31402.1 hypothetical protein KCTCHS21_08010 [Cohnella abietis]